jgi:hypothetical protein
LPASPTPREHVNFTMRKPVTRLLLALIILAGVFSLYLHPAFMVTLSNQIWACF